MSYSSNRIYYLDALRALAIVSVLVIHVFNFKYDSVVLYSPTWFICDINSVCFRIGVDLFLMLSGALSLGRDWTIKSFLSRRIPRIVAPFLFWTLLISIVLLLVSPIFSLNLVDPVEFLKNAFLGRKEYFYPNWFFWMILGTYLSMPIFNKWICHCDLKEVEYFLVLWLITCLFDFTLYHSFPIRLSYFTSPIGLVVLGYYLRHTERKLLNNIYFDIFLIVISSIIMILISVMLSTPDELYSFDRYSITNAIEVIGIFLLFKNLNLKYNDDLIHNFVIRLAKYSYGIYLVHAPILRVYRNFFATYNPPVKILAPSLFVLTLICSIILLFIFNKIPYVNRIIGVK